MANEVLFIEKQKFHQWWIWFIVIGLNSILLFAVYRQVFAGQPFGDNPMGDDALLLTFGLVLLFTLMFLRIRLETIIKSDGIYVRFFPFHIRFQFFPWESLKKVYIREYSPVADFGGWGLRWSLFGKGKAYNVSGSKGLQLELKNNRTLLIGTNQPEQLTTLLTVLGQLRA